MGRDRRKRDRRQATDADNANSNVEINTTADAQTPLEPRGQREPHNRAGQERRELSIKKSSAATETPTTENSSEKKEETKDAPPDPAVLFANLKRETDEIKALTEKKFSKRQIFSNWSRYDEPPPDPVEEQELPGADFKALCANISPGSSYFQLKSERVWDANISALSSELFSLNADNLSACLGCIPFYERLDLPITLFSEAEMKMMQKSAKSCKDQYELSKTDYYKKKEMDILNILRERSNAEDNLSLKGEREKTPDHKPTLSFNIDRPETPDEFEKGMLTEVCEQAHSVPARATRVSGDVAKKGSPEIVSEVISKIPETNKTPQDFRTSTHRPSPEKQETSTQGFKENIIRHNAEINFNATTRRGEVNKSPGSFEADMRRDPELFEKAEQSRKEISEEISGNISEKSDVALQRQSVSPETEKIKQLEANNTSPEIYSIVVQSELVPEEAVEESVPEPVPEILPPRQMNKNKSKDKRKQHCPVSTTSVTAAVCEITSPTEPELKSETEAMPNLSVNEEMKPREEEQKPFASAESLGQRSKKRRSKEKGQYGNKPLENTKMPVQEKSEITNKLTEEKIKPLAQETSAEKAKSPSPEKPFVKPQSAPQAKPAEIVKPMQDKVAESVKVVQEKPVEKAKPKEEKPIQKVKSKEEKTIEKVKPREEKVKAPAQGKTVEKVKQDDDLDFLLSLKKPVKESQVIPGASSQVSKPSIEEDDTSTKPAAFKFPQQTEDLEDWLDSVLDD